MSSRVNKPDTKADHALYKCLKTRQSFLMVAGAGSGKTTSLIKALHYIGQEYGEALRQNGQQVACITYTNVAVNEIWSDLEENLLYHVSTIHSFLWEIIKSFHQNIRQWVEQKIKDDINEKKEHNAKPRTYNSTKEKNRQAIQKLEKTLDKLKNVKQFRYGTGQRYADGILGHNDIIEMVPDLILRYPLLRNIAARKYPFVLVDESQDTYKQVVQALKAIALESKGDFCLGFFGDPMQKIYPHGVGKISPEENWETIEKEENFRSPTSVLSVINRIRAEGDSLKQTGGLTEEIEGERRKVSGSAQLFILPADGHRIDNRLKVQKWLAERVNDTVWLNNDHERLNDMGCLNNDQNTDVKQLVITHQMIAKQLGFIDIFDAFRGAGLDHFRAEFQEGTLWLTRPFINTLIPLVIACEQGNKYEIIRLLRERETILIDPKKGMAQKIKNPTIERWDASPRLEKNRLSEVKDPSSYLLSIRQDIDTLVQMMPMPSTGDSGRTIRDCLEFVHTKKLIHLDDRIVAAVNNTLTAQSLARHFTDNKENENDEENSDETNADHVKNQLHAIQTYLNYPVSQLWPYFCHMNSGSPFSTQQGVKGAEFKRVLVILDDEEGRSYSAYSFEQLFGLRPKEDAKRNDDETDTTVDRTRRLFYVCCSRAQKDLAVVLFTQDVEKAKLQMKSLKIFDDESIFTLQELVDQSN